VSTGSGAGSGLGAQLYGMLPEVYRTRDNGDLRHYVESCGEVLDLIRGVIGQRLADSFADHPDAQDWVLPYLAELLDVRLVSPGGAEQREELSQAVVLRQGKGTLGSVEQVVRTLGQYTWETDDPALEPLLPVYLQEGWKRVAVTPRVGHPLLSPEAVGALPVSDEGNPHHVGHQRHPALPVVTVDLRYTSRKVARPPREDRTPRAPVQQNPHGVPEALGHFDDVSRRTPDLRRMSARQGHVHPKRVVLFTLPRSGFLTPGWHTGDTAVPPLPEDPRRARPRRRQVSGPPPMPTSGEYVLEDVILPSGLPLTVPAGVRLVLRNCVVGGTVTLGAAAGAHEVEDSIVIGTVALTAGTLSIRRSAVKALHVATGTVAEAPATVEDSLLWTVTGTSLVKLLSVTVLQSLDVARCFANDSLFAGTVKTAAHGLEGPANCFRYCRLPASALGPYTEGGEAYACISDVPRFRTTAEQPGAGVLTSENSSKLLDGAEDGGELGAYHHRRYFLRDQAVLARVREFLPAGMDAVLVPDERLGMPLPVVAPDAP
jgi:hypothetical protein